MASMKELWLGGASDDLYKCHALGCTWPVGRTQPINGHGCLRNVARNECPASVTNRFAHETNSMQEA